MPPSRNDARTGAHPPVQLLSVRVPPGARRVPVAARQGQRKPVLVVRLPEVAADRSAGVALPDALWAAVEAACLAAARHDPDAADLLLR
jgi:hypothetical protein